MEITKKLLMTLVLVTFALLVVSKVDAGTTTPTCSLTATTSWANITENSTLSFGATTNVNMTNITFTIKPAPNNNGSVYYDSTTETNNLSTPQFQISNVPDGHYNISAIAKFMNYTATGPYVQESWNYTAFTATCNERSIDIDTTEGSFMPFEIEDEEEAKETELTTITLVVLLITFWYFVLRKKK